MSGHQKRNSMFEEKREFIVKNLEDGCSIKEVRVKNKLKQKHHLSKHK